MTRIVIEAAGSSLQAIAEGPLTAGMVGVPYTVRYDSSWNGLSKMIVFQAGTVTRNAVNGVVPWEVLAEPVQNLQVGIVGRREDGTIVIPTVWGNLGKVHAAPTEANDPTLEQENPVWAQSAAIAQQAMDKAANLEIYLQEHPAPVQSVNGKTGNVQLTAQDVQAVGTKQLPDAIHQALAQAKASGEFKGDPYTQSPEFNRLAAQVRADADRAAQSAQSMSGILDDTRMGADTVYSSAQWADMACPPFRKVGEIVSCSPPPGSAIHVVSRIGPKQGHAVRRARMTRCGANFIDPQFYSNKVYHPYGMTVTSSGPHVTITGTPNATGRYLSFQIAEVTDSWFVGRGIIPKIQVISGSNRISKVYGLTKDGSIAIVTTLDSKVEWNMELMLYAVQDENSPYEPYRGENYDVDFGQTVYAGSYDWETGTLEVTHGPDGAALPEPLVSQILPRTVGVLPGTNILYSDCGETVVSGRTIPAEAFLKENGGFQLIEEADISGVTTVSRDQMKLAEILIEIELPQKTGEGPNGYLDGSLDKSDGVNSYFFATDVYTAQRANDIILYSRRHIGTGGIVAVGAHGKTDFGNYIVNVNKTDAPFTKFYFSLSGGKPFPEGTKYRLMGVPV